MKQAATVIIRRCPDCGAQAYVTSRGELPAPGGDLPRTLTPALRRTILARDGHRCQGPGCTSTRFLEVHHRKPRANGGTNDPSNLITLCSACHQLHHARGLAQAAMGAPAARGSP
ncbi:MAG: HNH endonuclease [Candidatus Latescibacteria bacterium]|nr:HNH endonuclease [Candidatus Latescibacterota bacterium]